MPIAPDDRAIDFHGDDAGVDAQLVEQRANRARPGQFAPLPI
jgi:hypothetical protein